MSCQIYVYTYILNLDSASFIGPLAKVKCSVYSYQFTICYILHSSIFDDFHSVFKALPEVLPTVHSLFLRILGSFQYDLEAVVWTWNPIIYAKGWLPLALPTAGSNTTYLLYQEPSWNKFHCI